MKVAFVHYWLLGMRGGEKVLEALCRIYPDADIFTLFYDPDSVSEEIRRHQVTASYLNPLRKHYRSLLPLMPTALESFDLRGYDLIVSNESGPAKGVLTHSRARHVCYCHTPMRYLWELYPAYLHDWTQSSMKRWLMQPLASALRVWDHSTAARVDDFVASSENARQRIWRTYRREARVLHPPVSVGSFYHKPSEGYFLMVSELVAYKQLDYAIRVCANLGLPLKVVGDGPELKRLRAIGGSNVEFCGRIPDAELRDLYARARAFLMPGEEDFGITTVEALASGKPVVALGRGGSLEIVPSFGGVLYAEASETHLTQALKDLERLERGLNPKDLQTWVLKFSESAFAAAMKEFLEATEPVVPLHLLGKSQSNT